VLRKRGVTDDHVYLFVDMDPAQLTPFLSPFGITKNIHSPATLAGELAKLTGYENAIIVVTGHGTPTGIATKPAITPHLLLQSFRGLKGIKTGAIILGQCYAGIFNFADAEKATPLVFIGAANLDLSLSIDITLKQPIKDKSGADALPGWRANSFLLHLFFWLHSPTDIDGDGHFSLMDAYKYSGAAAAAQVREARAMLHLGVGQKQAALQQLQAQGAPKLMLDTIATSLKSDVDNLYVNPEPWILHARLAPRIRF